MEHCLICLEHTNVFAIAKCNCKFFIHQNCMIEWQKIHNVCIICKKELTEENKSKWQYLMDEFENLIQYDALFEEINTIDTYIEHAIILIIFVLFIPILIYKMIVSQYKYIKYEKNKIAKISYYKKLNF